MSDKFAGILLRQQAAGAHIRLTSIVYDRDVAPRCETKKITNPWLTFSKTGRALVKQIDEPLQPPSGACLKNHFLNPAVN